MKRSRLSVCSRFGKIQCTTISYKYEEFAATTILKIIKAAISCVRTMIFFSGLRNLSDWRIVVTDFHVTSIVFVIYILIESRNNLNYVSKRIRRLILSFSYVNWMRVSPKSFYRLKIYTIYRNCCFGNVT